MKKTIEFHEIIECSSQKSLLDGQPGFGIRAITEGLDAGLARKVTEQLSCTYEVDIDRQVSMQKIEDNPAIVATYPRTLKYSEVKDNEGKTRYVVGCSTYVGIDYGYFCGSDSAMRTGSNYIGDILIFDEKPSAQLFYELLRQKVFMPVDNTCRADNPELVRLLTGEPSYLPKRSIVLDSRAEPIDETTARVAIALLQTKINADLGKTTSLQNIVLRAEEADVPMSSDGPGASHTLDILKSFAALPDCLVSDKYFQTNYLQGYGMPTGYRMVFVNKHSAEVYTDNYVFLNLEDGTSKNIDSNFFYDKLLEAARNNDRELFFNLASYLCSVTVHPDTDYEFLYHLYIATETQQTLDLAVLTEDFFRKVEKTNLPSDKLYTLKQNIGSTLSAAIPDNLPDDAQELSGLDKPFVQSLKVIAMLLNGHKQFLDVFQELIEREDSNGGSDKQKATNVLFCPNRESYLLACDLTAIRYLNTSNVSEAEFFAALEKVADWNVWWTLVHDKYGEDYTLYPAPAFELIAAILSSEIADKAGLITKFFPIPEHSLLLTAYIYANPDKFKTMAAVVTSICRSSHTQNSTMLSFLNSDNYVDEKVPQDAVSVLQPVANDIFTAVFRKGKAKNTEENPCYFMHLLDSWKITGFDFTPLISDYERACYQNPLNANTAWVDWFVNNDRIALSDGKAIFKAVKVLRDVQPDDVQRLNALSGTIKDLLITVRMRKDWKVRVAVLRKWLNQATANDMQIYVQELDDKQIRVMPLEIEDTLHAIWQLPSGREELTDVYLKTVEWSKPDRKRFLKADCKNSELATYLEKPHGIWQKFVGSMRRITTK